MDPSSQRTESSESGRLYRLITRHWPRVAVVLVFAVGLFEWVVGGLTADSELEVYAFAWAAMTGGLWFLFEKAEKALSDEARGSAAAWLTETGLAGKLASIPSQFALLFDRVFGARHVSWMCFLRSGIASILVVGVLFIAFIAGFPDPVAFLADEGAWPILQFLLLATVVNVIPDYVSLFETRYLLRFMSTRRRIVPVLLLDVFVTGLISFTAVVVGMNYIVPLPSGDALHFGVTGAGLAGFGFDWPTLWGLLTLSGTIGGTELKFVMTGTGSGAPDVPFGFFFYSAFFTSVWLWIYGLAVLVSRGLVRIGSGAGFLLRLTDVERQPFRSMGFTAVVLVSLAFLLGLPFALVL